MNFLSALVAVFVYFSSLLGLTPGASTGTDSTAGRAQPVFYPSGREVMAYYVPSSSAGSSLTKAANALTEVIPVAYHIDATGKVTGRVDRGVLALAHEQGLKIIAIVDNSVNGVFDGNAAKAFLGNKNAQAKAIGSLSAELSRNGLDGINLDFEQIHPGLRNEFTDFVRDLSDSLRPHNFLVTASLPAKASDDPSSAWWAYDYRALSPYLDRVIIMAYDEHVSGGSPGPVASIDWVKESLNYAVSVVPGYKIILGLPAYGYLWSDSKDTAVSYGTVSGLLARYRVSPSWDDRAQVPYFSYKQAGASHEVWYENSSSLGAKTDLVRQYGLRGVAVWRLGFEDPGIWAAIAQRLEQNGPTE